MTTLAATERRPVAFPTAKTRPMPNSACESASIGMTNRLVASEAHSANRARSRATQFSSRMNSGSGNSKNAPPIAMRQLAIALHRQRKGILVEFCNAGLLGAFGQNLRWSRDFRIMTTPVSLRRNSAWSALMTSSSCFSVEYCLMNTLAGDVGRAPPLEVDRALTIIERVESRRLEHSMVERISDDMDHVMHVADVMGRDPARDEIPGAQSRASAQTIAGKQMDQTDRRSE